MKKNLVRIAIGLAVVLIVGGTALFITRLLSPDENIFGIPGIIAEMKSDPTPEQQAILDTDFDSDKDPINPETVSTKEGVHNTLHYMLNTKIIAVDGKYWGLKPITRENVDIMQKAVTDLQITDTRITGMLDRWSKQDFSQSVDDHNYIWSFYLDGNVGKAVKLAKVVE